MFHQQVQYIWYPSSSYPIYAMKISTHGEKNKQINWCKIKNFLLPIPWKLQSKCDRVIRARFSSKCIEAIMQTIYFVNINVTLQIRQNTPKIMI